MITLAVEPFLGSSVAGRISMKIEKNRKCSTAVFISRIFSRCERALVLFTTQQYVYSRVLVKKVELSFTMTLDNFQSAFRWNRRTEVRRNVPA